MLPLLVRGPRMTGNKGHLHRPHFPRLWKARMAVSRVSRCRPSMGGRLAMFPVSWVTQYTARMESLRLIGFLNVNSIAVLIISVVGPILCMLGHSAVCGPRDAIACPVPTCDHHNISTFPDVYWCGGKTAQGDAY